MLISLENEPWNLLLGSTISVINHMDSFSLWNLLHTAMVPSLDFSSKRDTLNILCFMDDSYHELLY